MNSKRFITLTKCLLKRVKTVSMLRHWRKLKGTSQDCTMKWVETSWAKNTEKA